jgi:DNA-binding transcriptional MerR regulator
VPDVAAPEPEAGADEYRIDELAREAGATVRNVRAYQDRGLLPPPRRVGRVGWYSASHLARLRLIGELLGRGYTLANIAEMLEGWERGQDLGELLGLESALIGPWSDDRSAPADPTELAALIGGVEDPEVLAEAQRLGVVEVVGGEIRVKNPKVLETAATLVQAGVPLPELLAVLQTVSTAMDQVAATFVEMAVTHLFAPFGNAIPAAEVPRLAGLVRTLRPLATSVVDGELARAMERRIQVEMGALFAREQRAGQAAS